MWHKILVGLDGSDGAKKAFSVAVKLASQFGAELHSISVEEKLPHYAATVGEVLESKQEAADYFRRITAEASQSACAAGVTLHSHVMPGHEVETIVTFAREKGFDLLVIGFMGHSRIFGRIWGSTSQNLTKLSPCTVLVVK
ncbi:MAG: universal stress protein [Nitrospiraceae bacterium]|nr:MAG: universal stress protein [Nitrospiraceae bacterium]